MKNYLIINTLLFLPITILAADLDLGGFLDNTIYVLYYPTIKIIFALAFIYFFWGIVSFIFSADDVKKREDGKKRMIWGIITLFVMFSIWGIMSILDDTFNLNNNPMDVYPDFHLSYRI